MTLVIPRRAYAVEWSDGAAGPLLRDEEESWLDREPSWQDFALCSQTDPEAFFPEKGGSVREAKRVCRSCEVRAECLEYALDNDEKFGIWGGLSERERRLAKRENGRPAADVLAEADERAGRRKPPAHLENGRFTTATELAA